MAGYYKVCLVCYDLIKNRHTRYAKKGICRICLKERPKKKYRSPKKY